MLSVLAFAAAIVVCVLNIFFDQAIRLEWVLGFIAAGFLLAGVGPALRK